MAPKIRSNSIATCGHRLTRKEIRKTSPVIVKAMQGDLRSYKIMLLCTKCLRLATEKGAVLTTQDEKRKWLSGEDPRKEVY